MVRACEVTKVFNIQPATTPRRHQFAFHSGRNDNNLVRIPLIFRKTDWKSCTQVTQALYGRRKRLVLT